MNSNQDQSQLNGGATLAPATCSADIAIYHDGSGKASDQLAENLKTIEEREAVHKIMRAFIEKHKDTLAGMYWKVGYLGPEIELSAGMYRGQKAGPKVIAALWPNAEWTRQQEKYGRADEIQWWAEVDGITLKIQNAERLEPLPKPRIGQKVRI